MEKKLHVVLGASGVIGKSVVEELKRRNKKIRAVERNRKTDGVESVKADVMDLEETISALKGADYVYMCIGLPYNTKIWQKQWPIIIENVIEACHIVKAKLVFLDNIYMYGPTPLDVPFTESHSREPISKKGVTRKHITNMVLKAHQEGKLEAVIGRSADFYGPGAKNSPIYISFIERIIENKHPQSLGKTNIKHTYSYTKDNGRALVELALNDSAYGQEWHLPVSKPVTIDEVVDEINLILGTTYNASVVPRVMLKLIGKFVPTVNSVVEMLYQADYTYIMSDEKFRKHFPEFKVTEFEEGLKEMIHSFM